MSPNIRKHLHDAVWLASGQALAAVGTLVGVRLLTHALPPQTFGAISLGLAGVALMIATLCTPLTQAVIHSYAAYAQNGRLYELRSGLRLAAKRMLRWAVPAFVLAIAVCAVAAPRWLSAAVLLMLLLASDVRRSVHISVLNAARRHRRYAIWTACDACARPLVALAAVLTIAQSPAVVFGAHLLASLTLTAVFSSRLFGNGAEESVVPATDGAIELSARLWQFALPLIPVGLISWSNNLSDRYIIGGMLGLDAAGVYAATFGLASAPFIMLTAVLEQAFRPAYQDAVSSQRRDRAERVFGLWLLTTIVVALLGVLAFSVFRELIAELLLGPLYRSAATLMPWIAAGYALRAVACVFERVCYVHARTARVLIVQLCVLAATLTVTPLAILMWGLQGAAFAVPICFAIYLAAAIGLARLTLFRIDVGPALQERRA